MAKMKFYHRTSKPTAEQPDGTHYVKDGDNLIPYIKHGDEVKEVGREIVQELGNNANKAISQKVVTDILATKANHGYGAGETPKTLKEVDDNLAQLNEVSRSKALLVTGKQTGGIKQLSFEINEDGGLNLILDEIYELDTPIWEGFTLGQIFSSNLMSTAPFLNSSNAGNITNSGGIVSANKLTINTVYCYLMQAVPTPSRLFAKIVYRCSAPNYTFRVGTTPSLVTLTSQEDNSWNILRYAGDTDTTGKRIRYEFSVLGAEQQTIEIDLNNSIVVDTSMFSVQPTIEQMDNWYNEYLKLK